MSLETDLTAQRLREVLAYDAETGLFTWIAQTGRRINVGGAAGTKTHRGYIAIGVFRRIYRAHRLAWMYVYGEWPVGQIDHIDGNRDNNSIANLRDVSASVNSQNQRRARSNSASGLLGVSIRYKRWKAEITVDGKWRHLGCYATPELAHAAYIEAKRLLHVGCTI